MLGRRVSLFATALAVFALAASAWAANKTKKTITLRQSAQVGDQTLAPGEYNLTVDGDQATFSQKGKVVAKVPVEWKENKLAAQYDSIAFDSGRITEFYFAGKKQAVVFASGTTTAAGSDSHR